jgi:hypothetical protein
MPEVPNPERYRGLDEVLPVQVDPVLAQPRGSERWVVEDIFKDACRFVTVGAAVLVGGSTVFVATALAIEKVLGSFVPLPTLYNIDLYSVVGTGVASVSGLVGGYFSGRAVAKLLR